MGILDRFKKRVDSVPSKEMPRITKKEFRILHNIEEGYSGESLNYQINKKSFNKMVARLLRGQVEYYRGHALKRELKELLLLNSAVEVEEFCDKARKEYDESDNK